MGFNLPDINFNEVVTALAISAITGMASLLALIGRHLSGRSKRKALKKLEDEIREQYKLLAAIPEQQLGRAIGTGQLIVQSVLDRWIEEASKPIKKEIARLEREREFMIR